MTPWHEEAMLLRERARKYIDAVHALTEARRDKEMPADKKIEFAEAVVDAEQMLEIGITVCDNMDARATAGKGGAK